MATWTTIPNTVLETGKPIRAVDGRALRDNPIAISEGAVGAPRVLLPGLERLTAGTAIRSRNDAERQYFVASGDSGTATLFDFSFIQHGVIRFTFQHRRVNTASSYGSRLIRLRNDATTTLATYASPGTSYTTHTLDVAVIPGDRVYLEGYINGSGNLSIFYRNVRIQTNGEDLWPGVYAKLEGNRSAP